ncbi:hypothetical protein M5K25_015492 [Dendrobium thyrsiflorum]|uniref:Uncharacterized protein n=1 Tax=Dendrobium thyrsiflorum TaxID=117978 RepID=A0ABD0UQX1_DENTH
MVEFGTANQPISWGDAFNQASSAGTLRPKLEGIKRETEDRSCPLAPPRPPPEFCRTTAGPPPKGPKFRRTTT